MARSSKPLVRLREQAQVGSIPTRLRQSLNEPSALDLNVRDPLLFRTNVRTARLFLFCPLLQAVLTRNDQLSNITRSIQTLAAFFRWRSRAPVDGCGGRRDPERRLQAEAEFIRPRR